MKILIATLLAGCLLSSCSPNKTDKAHAREVFNARGLKVITSFANRRQHTISVLYGNDSALQSASAGSAIHVAGEDFKLVTFGQANNTYWYGSYINGAVKSIETVHIKLATPGNRPTVHYTLEHGKAPLGTDGKAFSTAERINNILQRRALVFPQ